MKNFIATFLLVISTNSFALTANECRELISDIHSVEGREEWMKCLFSDSYVRKDISAGASEQKVPLEKAAVFEESKNKVFDLSLGVDAISELKRLSKNKKIRIGYSDCSESRCEISDSSRPISAHFVFDKAAVNLYKNRSKLSEHDLEKPIKSKADFSDFKTKPALSEIGLQVVKIEVIGDRSENYLLYIQNGILIAVRPVQGIMDELPLDKKEMVNVLDGKYSKLKTLYDKTKKEKYSITKTSILRWRMNDDVEIRLYSDEGESINYSACMVAYSAINAALKMNLCLPSKTNVLAYVLKAPFDALENEISTKQSEIADSLWSEYQRSKNKF